MISSNRLNWGSRAKRVAERIAELEQQAAKIEQQLIDKLEYEAAGRAGAAIRAVQGLLPLRLCSGSMGDIERFEALLAEYQPHAAALDRSAVARYQTAHPHHRPR